MDGSASAATKSARLVSSSGPFTRRINNSIRDGPRESNIAGRFELFLDLLYVAILANFAETLAEDVSGVGLVKYIVSLPYLSVHAVDEDNMMLIKVVDPGCVMARLE